MSDENTPTDGAENTTVPVETGETNPVIDTPVEDAPPANQSQAAAFDQMMAIVGQIATEPGALVAPHQPIDRLERARALPEIPKDVESRPAGEPIRSFKDADRRTMNVVIVAGELFKQEV